MPETIGARLERIAKDSKGWTLSQFAEQLDVSYETVRKWVTGETAPNRRRLERICELLPVSPAMVLFGHEESAPKPANTQATKPADARARPAPVYEITETDWGHLQEFKDMNSEDVEFIRAETHRRHLRHKKVREEILAEVGMKAPAVAPGAQLPLAPRDGVGQSGSVLVKVAHGNAPATKPRLNSRFVGKRDKSPLTVGVKNAVKK